MNGIDKKKIRNVLTFARKKVESTPIYSLSWVQKEEIVNYFALAEIYMKDGQCNKAEAIFKELFALCRDRPDSSEHGCEMLFFEKLLERALRQQSKMEEAEELAKSLLGFDAQEKADTTESIWKSVLTAQVEAIDLCDFMCDPDKKFHQEQEQQIFDTILAREVWHDVRQHRFKELERRTSMHLLSKDPFVSGSQQDRAHAQ
uniref:Uncharacterized protein n=1 Tax=Ditylum brightwellii TaxID=49249 RepID=A0A7S4UMZ0_9STRA